MDDNKMKLYQWEDLNWDIRYDLEGRSFAYALCPKKNCYCKIPESPIFEHPFEPIYTYRCVNCGYEITLNKTIESKSYDFLSVIASQQYKDAEIINIDGELIRIQREEIKDEDYWIDAKISKNKKGELQLMVLAGSRKSADKAQLFLDPQKERFAFDQNNDHPTQIFAKVVGIFKNSKSEIYAKDEE
jgi:hypothetical protein